MVTWGFCCLNFFKHKGKTKIFERFKANNPHGNWLSGHCASRDSEGRILRTGKKYIFLGDENIYNQMGLKWMGKDISPHVLANYCLRSRRIFPYLAAYHYPWRLFVPLRDGRAHKTNSCLIQWDNCCYTREIKSYSLNFPSYYWILTTFTLLMQWVKKKQTFQALCY